MMQCSPAFYGSSRYPEGYPNHFGQFRPCSHSFQQVPQPSVYPEIIGEGEVVSVIYPDGSVHLYFIPLNKRQVAPNWHPYHNSYDNNNTMGAYYVRSISNPITPAVFHQQCQKMYAGPYSSPCFISESINIPSPGFQLKFHNDCWTSTTDLHYFFPCIRQCEWFPSSQPHGSAAVQVDMPVKERSPVHQEESTKPCLCSQGEDKNMSGTDSADECLCTICSIDASSNKSKRKQDSKNIKCKARQKQKLAIKKSDVTCECHQASTSKKSLETYADQDKCRARQKQKLAIKKSDETCECHQASTSNKSMATYAEQDKCGARQKQKLAIKKSDETCECHQASTSNKSMATYAEQASGCAASNERNTQTCPSASSAATSISGVKRSVVNRSDVKTELWLPKTSESGKAMTTKSSEKILGVFESTHSSATCCCSDAESN